MWISLTDNMNINHKDLTLEEIKTISLLEFTSMEMDDSDVTIRQWLGELLCRVWMEKNEFSGKRAFGNSDWEYEVYKVLIHEGIIHGGIDDYGEVEISYEERIKANNIILEVITEIMA